MALIMAAPRHARSCGASAGRFLACKPVLHLEKTKIIYCKDANRQGDFPIIAFDVLGFQFRARKTTCTAFYPLPNRSAHQANSPTLEAAPPQR